MMTVRGGRTLRRCRAGLGIGIWHGLAANTPDTPDQCLDNHMSCNTLLQFMNWTVEIADEFEPEFAALADEVQDEIAALRRLLVQFGPALRRPHCDTLKGSRYVNMKELRFSAADGEWRVAFAFDPERKAILLVAGDKSGGSERRFYKVLIRVADERFAAHLQRMKDK
jgi:hypothetical protein